MEIEKRPDETFVNIHDWLKRLNAAILNRGNASLIHVGNVIGWTGSGYGGQHITAVRLRLDRWGECAKPMEATAAEIANVIGEPGDRASFICGGRVLSVLKRI